uniref:Ribitol-5-phosphate transferase n=1 Tax=Paramormyrops kingsleyae TaxID=1676925 RepID=A0A3B3SC44_9TELE
MRISFCQGLLTGAIALNLLILYYVSRAQQQMMEKRRDSGKPPPKKTPLPVSGLGAAGGLAGPVGGGAGGAGNGRNPRVTVLVREFEDFENYVGDVARSFLQRRPEVPFLAVADLVPYPPLALPESARLLVLSPSPDQPPQAHRPEFHVQTEYVLLVPDGVELEQGRQLERLIRELEGEGGGPVRLVATPVLARSAVQCLHLRVSLREWTVTYTPAASGSSGSVCTALRGDAVILMRSEDLFNLSSPLARPLLASLFIQTSLRGWKVKLLEGPCFAASHRPLFSSAHNQWKADSRQREATGRLMRDFGIKRLVQPDGKEQWFGCGKETARCFGTVKDDTPEYLYLERWTPPCCLRALRETTKYVINILETAGVRYWLEGGSLLGAARHQDVIPWDYDVDLGIYLEDVPNCEYLKNLDAGSLVDANGVNQSEVQTQGSLQPAQRPPCLPAVCLCRPTFLLSACAGPPSCCLPVPAHLQAYLPAVCLCQPTCRPTCLLQKAPAVLCSPATRLNTCFCLFLLTCTAQCRPEGHGLPLRASGDLVSL